MRDSVPSTRYSSVCNVLRQWNIPLIPTYRVYRLYDILLCILSPIFVCSCIYTIPLDKVSLSPFSVTVGCHRRNDSHTVCTEASLLAFSYNYTHLYISAEHEGRAAYFRDAPFRVSAV